jgi:hypothetical protein
MKANAKPLKGDCRDAFSSTMGNSNTRTAPTTPPPPAMLAADDIEQRAADLEAFANGILSRSREMRAVASKMRGAR